MALTKQEESELQAEIAFFMNEISRLFKPGAKISVVVTNDAHGDAGVFVTNDDPARVIAEIQRRVPATATALRETLAAIATPEGPKEQMNVGQVLDAIARLPDGKPVLIGKVGASPGGVMSYRGYYEELAIYAAPDGEVVSVASLRRILSGAVGKTFTGYKGGNYRMDRRTPLWVSEYGAADGTIIVGVREESECVRLLCEETKD
jgi:hypothetical protein